MSTDYVSDYEELDSVKRFLVETKVVNAPVEAILSPETVAEVK